MIRKLYNCAACGCLLSNQDLRANDHEPDDELDIDTDEELELCCADCLSDDRDDSVDEKFYLHPHDVPSYLRADETHD